MKNIIGRAFKAAESWDLTDYQRQFINSLEKYYRKNKRLTPAQSKVLMTIWDTKTPVGGRGLEDSEKKIYNESKDTEKQ